MQRSARKKGDLPWLKLAELRNKRTAKGSLRHDANVLQITGIELDYDGEKITFDDMVRAVRAMNISALVYTSPSHVLPRRAGAFWLQPRSRSRLRGMPSWWQDSMAA